MIFNEIKDVKQSIQENIKSVRSYGNRTKSIIRKNIKSYRANSKSMNQYIQCISKSLKIEYGPDVMTDFENVVNSIEKKYDINHPKSLQIKECFDNERKIYENVKTESNQEICGELKQLNQRDKNVLSNWLTFQRIHINYLNLNLFIYRFLTELAGVGTS
ncbi:hypothetical protein MS3_00011155 [Schistosoma haematobium]|uniref:Uncharacterized protein n=1 Tax=Schistosoma haematobium TaxID=6185 RepID=A0A922IJA1_SCHHA|nr:hypothetical protein MS3_00011155 [Schistosoma haematobium]KAH9580836.1 hypothetical protein MS3_00011155 [Schistosoma haematobium]